jgi:hypothetical protein
MVSRATNAKSIPVNRIVMLGSGPPEPPAKPSPVWVDSTITFSGRMSGKSWRLAGDDVSGYTGRGSGERCEYHKQIAAFGPLNRRTEHADP